VATVLGTAIPANPLRLIPAETGEGRRLQLRIDVADLDNIQVWSGIFGDDSGKWVRGSAELLWPGSRVYLRGEPDPEDPATFLVKNLRIVEPPSHDRTALLLSPSVADALKENQSIALLGSREQPAIFLLDQEGQLHRVGETGQAFRVVDGRGGSALLLPKTNAPTGINSFTWIRADGVALQIFARPFYNVQGVAGDTQGNVWWIETPQALLDQWQLWRYNVGQGEIELVEQQSMAQLRPGVAPGEMTLELIAVLPASDTDPRPASILVDTAEPPQQRLYSGLLRLPLPGSSVQAETLLAPGEYRGPLTISPDGRRLAYFRYDPDHPSLTAGFVKPANQLYVMELRAGASGQARRQPVYATETRWEFLAPTITWLDSSRLAVVRSRFAPGDLFALDRFGVVLVRLAEDGEASTTSYLFPRGELLKDLAGCQEGEEFLLSVSQEEQGDYLARWNGEGPPAAIADLPFRLDRVLACWRLPQGALTIRR